MKKLNFDYLDAWYHRREDRQYKISRILRITLGALFAIAILANFIRLIIEIF
jgi:hypothetical protein